MFQRTVVVVCAMLISLGALWAQDGQGRAQAVMPWITADTAWIVSARIADVDLDAGGKWVLKTMEQAVDPAEQEKARQDINQGLMFVRGLREELKAAGVTEIYAIYDAPMGHGDQLLVVIPAGTNAQAVADKLRPLVGQAGQVDVEQSAVLVVMDGRRADRSPASDRPELATALSSSDAAVVMALTMPDALRNEMPQQLPPQIGGADASAIKDGFLWATVELRFAPEPALKGVAQMDGAENAKGAMDVIKSVIDAGIRDAAERPEGEFLRQASKHLTPEVKDEQLVVDLSSARLNEVVAAMGPPMRRARESAKQVASASTMRQLHQGVLMYAADNKGATPDRLEQLERYFGGNMQHLMTSPRFPERKPAYIYVKQAEHMNPPAGAHNTVMLYESYDQWPGGINVGYVDGHVEWIADEARFLEQLKASGGSK